MAKPKRMSPAEPPAYETLKAELDRLMLELQREDLEVDLALQHYHRGLELVRELEAYLDTAENTVRSLQTKFGTPKD